MLKVELTHKFDFSTINEDQFNKIIDIVSWKETPYFPHRGRMAWNILDTPVQIKDNPVYSLKAIKIKGVGVYNPQSDAKNRDPIFEKTMSKPLPPTTQPLESFVSYPHLGFTDNGEFKVAYGSVAPIGGIVHDRAIKEYQTAQHLINNNIPSIVPLAVFKYDSTKLFQGQHLGVVCSFSPSIYPLRLSEVQFGAALEPGKNVNKDLYYNLILESLNIGNTITQSQAQLQCLSKIAYQVGHLMHDFSYSGLYRYSAEFPNFEFDFNRSTPVITDLDSTEFLNDLPQHLRALQVLRDMASMVYHFVAKLATPNSLGKYNFSQLRDANPLLELLTGYFGEIYREKLAKETKKLWLAFAPHYILLNKYKQEILSEWTVKRRRSYKMDHHLFFILVIITLQPYFVESELRKKFGDDGCSLEDLLKKSRLFLDDERFSYLQLLLEL